MKLVIKHRSVRSFRACHLGEERMSPSLLMNANTTYALIFIKLRDDILKYRLQKFHIIVYEQYIFRLTMFKTYII